MTDENALERRVAELCRSLYIQNDYDVIHALASAYRYGLSRIFGVKVAESYYQFDLATRAQMIGTICTSTDQLCKCLLYENRLAPLEAREFEYSRYYCLIYQYRRKFSMAKFSALFKNLAKSKHPELTKSNFKWKFVPTEVAVSLAGSEFNGMSFLGFRERIPIVFDSTIKENCCFVGGLERLTKVRVDIAEVCAVLGARRYLITDEKAESAAEDSAEDQQDE